MTPNTRASASIAVIAATIAGSAFVGYLVTTFLFAFSGGQYRMIAVVNYGVLAMVAITTIVAAATWRLRSGQAAAKVTAAAAGIGWACTIFVEWLLSFRLGAGG